ncbi:MAG: flagellar motor switch protein FliN [Solirubrobacteraceae bacterium]
MTETIEYEQFEQSGNGSAPTLASASDVDLSRLSDIPMELSVEIGRTHMTVGETLDLRVGSVVTLERLAGETADLLVNGSAIARGEVVVIDEQYGLRITEILDGQSDPASSPEGELAQPAAGAAGSGDGDGDGAGQQDATPASVAAEPAAEAADGSPADEG